MSINNTRVFIDNNTQEITVDFEVDGTTISHPLDTSKELYQDIYIAALMQYEQYLRDQLEVLSSE